MPAEHYPNCQAPCSLHEIAQTLILLLSYRPQVVTFLYYKFSTLSKMNSTDILYHVVEQ